MKSDSKHKHTIVFLIFLFGIAFPAKSQTNLVFYHTADQVVSPAYNPAFLVNQKIFTLSVFPLTGMSVGYNNQKVINNMIFNLLSGNQTNDDFKNVFNSLIKLDLFYQRMEIPILNIGHNSKIGAFNFSIKDNMQLMTDLKGSFSEFLINKPEQSIALNSEQFFPALAIHYREYSLGYAKEMLDKRLSVGFRAKLYFGKFSMKSEAKGEVVQKADNFYLQTHDKVNISFPIEIIPDADSVLRAVKTTADFSVGSYMLNKGNVGAGFDIGFTYKLNKEMVFSASMVDVGKINWKNNLNSINFKGESQFPTEYVKQLNGNVLTKKEGFSAETYDIPQLYKIEMDQSAYSTWLPTSFYLGFNYLVNRNFTFGIVDRYIHAKNTSFNAISITGKFDINKKLVLSTGYALLGNSYFNVPLAVIYNRSGGQYFVGTDNLFSLFSQSNSSFAGMTFGACFFLFRSKQERYSEIKYLPFYKEKKN